MSEELTQQQPAETTHAPFSRVDPFSRVVAMKPTPQTARWRIVIAILAYSSPVVAVVMWNVIAAIFKRLELYSNTWDNRSLWLPVGYLFIASALPLLYLCRPPVGSSLTCRVWVWAGWVLLLLVDLVVVAGLIFFAHGGFWGGVKG